MLPLRINHPNRVTIAETQDEFHALDVVFENGEMISLWELSDVERSSIARDGIVRLTIQGNRHPPVTLNAQQRNGEVDAVSQKTFIECVKELTVHAKNTNQHVTEIISGYAFHNDVVVLGHKVKYSERLPESKVVVKAGKNTVGALMFTETMSRNRIEKLLDYATAYGDFDQQTPNGKKSDVSSSPMNDERRVAIVTLKQFLGLV